MDLQHELTGAAEDALPSRALIDFRARRWLGVNLPVDLELTDDALRVALSGVDQAVGGSKPRLAYETLKGGLRGAQARRHREAWQGAIERKLAAAGRGS